MIRSSIEAFKPPYDGTVVHVDLNDSSIQQLNTYYVDRSQYARLIRNLAGMHVAAQAYDVLFAAGTDHEDDQALIEATREAGNVYFGMTFSTISAGLQGRDPLGRAASEVREFIDSTRWEVKVERDGKDFYAGTMPTITFPSLARSSKGIGFLTPNRTGTECTGVCRFS